MLSVAKHLCVYSLAQSARDSSEIESLASRALPAALQLRFDQNDITRSTTINAFIGEFIPKPRRCRASVSDADLDNRRFTEWSRGDGSDMDRQLVRARERERASQTPYNFFAREINVDRN